MKLGFRINQQGLTFREEDGTFSARCFPLYDIPLEQFLQAFLMGLEYAGITVEEIEEVK